MKVLIACEFSGIVREEFKKLGHDAWSCDLLPTEIPGNHYQGDIFEFLDKDMSWDLMIAHPPCTYLSNAGIGWFNIEKYGEKARIRHLKRFEAFGFVMKLAHLKIPKIAIENPVGYLNRFWRKPDQIIQPYQFGNKESKRTCLWLNNLPLLKPTEIVTPKIYGYYKKGKKKGLPIYGNSYLPFSEDRWKLRSKTFPGIARAMADQWSMAEQWGRL